MTTRYRCEGCNQIIDYACLLEAPHPFDKNDVIRGCPLCLQCEDGFTAICDADGCESIAGCGWSSEHGYRRTCFDHSCFKPTPSPPPAESPAQ
jgi:hypothetical protein